MSELRPARPGSAAKSPARLRKYKHYTVKSATLRMVWDLHVLRSRMSPKKRTPCDVDDEDDDDDDARLHRNVLGSQAAECLKCRSCGRDTLAERLGRRPAKPMGSPRVGSNPTGVVCWNRWSADGMQSFWPRPFRKKGGARTALRRSRSPGLHCGCFGRPPAKRIVFLGAS